MSQPDTICGYPFSIVKSVLKSITHGNYCTMNSNYFEESGLSIFKVRELIIKLIYEGYLTDKVSKRTRDASFPFNVDTTEIGHRLCTKSTSKRMKRPAIEKLMQTVITRCNELNELPCFISLVTDIYVFGSYLNVRNETYGDLDLVINFDDRDSFIGSEELIQKNERNMTAIIESFNGDYNKLAANICLRRDYLLQLKQRGVITYSPKKMLQYVWMHWDLDALNYHITRSNHRISIHSLGEFMQLNSETCLHIYSLEKGGEIEPKLV